MKSPLNKIKNKLVKNDAPQAIDPDAAVFGWFYNKYLKPHMADNKTKADATYKVYFEVTPQAIFSGVLTASGCRLSFNYRNGERKFQKTYIGQCDSSNLITAAKDNKDVLFNVEKSNIDEEQQTDFSNLLKTNKNLLLEKKTTGELSIKAQTAGIE